MTVITYLRLLHQESSTPPRMLRLLWDRGAAFLLYALACYVSVRPVAPQGHFPRLENIGAHKPVSVAPASATCGVPERSAFCQPSAVPAGLLTCTQQFCVQGCPRRTSSPHPVDLLSDSLGACLTADGRDMPPQANAPSLSFIFRNQSKCFASPPAPDLGPASSFTLTAWLKPEEAAVMTLIEKRAEGSLVFLLTVSEEELQFHYSLQSGETVSLTSSISGRISPGQWTHLALQVHETRVSLFLNGLEEDGTPFDTHSLAGPVADITVDSTVRIGQSSDGSNQFIGRIQDFRFYPKTLTNREVQEVFSGRLPQLHTQPTCRCPPSHPRVHPLLERYCIPNGADDTTNNRVLRLSLDAHPLHYINDNDIGTAWVSAVFLTPQRLSEGVTLTFDLQNGQYQVFYVILQFVSAQPTAVRIQRRSSGSSEWRDWQYLAQDCSLFGMENNGPLELPDSVNCLQFPSNVPSSHGNVTLSMLTPEPNLRPGYNDFYNTPTLQEFVRATQVRVHLQGQYHTVQPGVPFRHRYYALAEVTISGRCECHGHASRCDTSVNPYRCACVPESHTHGDNCERCAPLFNDKPFRPGNQVQAYNCRLCQCHGHASSCHYDVTVDPAPDEHFRGGGGVCDDCKHNTTGRNCERCKSLFYREAESVPWAEDVCKPCDCFAAGTVNSSLECEEIGGQCKCKRHVSGRRCNQCQHGFYKLHSSLAGGCQPCGCNTAGTLRAHITCHQASGQCQCKAHVIGRTCDRCDFGFKFLNHSNPDGCVSCDCDSRGSVNRFCDPLLGQCECKEHVRGLRCDTCAPGFYGLSAGGSCQACDCDAAGTVPGTVCDPLTGQCQCKPNAEGRRCSSCRDGYHSLDRTNSLGCLACQCEPAGTTDGSNICNKTTGQCVCERGVEGPRCERCSPHSYNRTSADGSFECAACGCDPLGTVPGSVCDPDDGQCVCLTRRHGQNCSTCRIGFFLSDRGTSGCEACDCHPVGAVNQACDPDTGQCGCGHPSLAGRRCDQCRPLHYGFNPGMGRCEECGCDAAGSVNVSCHPETGQCVCKAFVTGEKCDTCVQGASHMDPDNYLGCSKAPSQQPPPLGQALGSSAIQLTWSPPDSPNSHLLMYTLHRDFSNIHSVQSHYPFEAMAFTDDGLSPYTVYSYRLVTSNIHGNTSSTPVRIRTLAAVPDTEELQLNLLGRAGPDHARFNWSEPVNTSGPVERYTLVSVDERSGEERLHYTGLRTEATAGGLQPFTRYSFTLQACTNGGCAQSDGVTVVTAQIPPRDQPPPTISTLGPNQLHLQWAPPTRPNGIIIRYEVFMRGPSESLRKLSNHSFERRVFLSSGWLDLTSVLDSANKNALTPPENSTVVMDLEPFSSYSFRVLTFNMAGSTVSEWATGRTAEGVPEYMPPPQVSALSSSSLRVTWTKPRDTDARGEVTQYKVNIHQEQASNPYAPPVTTQVLFSGPPEEQSYTARGLKPYQNYNFSVTLCNRQGCVTSLPSSGRTLPAAPAGLRAPTLLPVNMTAIAVSWPPPEALNGPPPLYHVERTDVSLSDGTDRVVRGTRFTGVGYFRFPSSALPTDSDFTGLELSFRTRAEQGLILCALSPGDQTEYVAVQIREGRPFFLFDPQGSAVAVSPENDGGRRYNDDQWHHVIASRKQAVGTIIVDSQYRGSASATSGSVIIGQNTGLFVGGLPENFTVLRRDTGHARLVRQGFSGCLRDVLVMKADGPEEVWRPLDWDTAVDREEVYESWEGCPLHSQNGAHFLGQGFLKLKADVFSGGEEFEISFDFRTDQLNALLLFGYDTDGDDFLLAELQEGILSWTLRWRGHTSQVSQWIGLSYCDGSWNSLSLLKRGALISTTLNEVSEHERASRGGSLKVSSPLYLGGVPTNLHHPGLQMHSLQHGFGGCVKDVRLRRGPVVSLAAVASSAVRVNLDGCLSAASGVNCRGNDSILVYAGRERITVDLTLQPFTEYLYRVLAIGEGGWTAGPWQRGRSRETVPQSVLAPSRAVSVNGWSVEVGWEEAVGVRGVIEKYIVRAYDRDNPSSSPISATFTHTQHLTGVLSGLAAFSRYGVTVTACTQAGCVESPSRSMSTPQEAPEEVTPPQAVSYPTSLSLHWGPPHRPNGIITEYRLYKDHSIIYQGNGTELNVTGLAVYSPHRLVLTACTIAGCSNSSQVTVFTGQLPPSHMPPPVLTVLDSRSVYVQWAKPLEVNGLLEFYMLYQSVPGQSEPAVVYNSSELFEDHTLRNLVPGTTYLFQIAACSGGGCTLSGPSVAHTDESTPEEVPPPDILPLSPHAFNVSWSPPLKPNGVIISYGVWMNGVLVQNSSSLHYEVGGLSPWSLHGFRVQACTAEGCARGPLVEARTLEAAPLGVVDLEVQTEGPRSVSARWQAPAKPNGNLTYSVLFTETFNYSSVDSVGGEQRELYRGSVAGEWVSVSGLLPYTDYSVTVQACNSQGCVDSAPVTVTLPPAAPDGVMPPRLAAATPTVLQVTWSTPERPNAPGPLRYRLQMRTTADQQIQELVDSESTSFSHTVEGLRPYTEYLFRLIVSHAHGESSSTWTHLFTAEDRPGSIDPPFVSSVRPRSATLSWMPPSEPNGIITHYNIYQDGQLTAEVPGNTTTYTADMLQPFHNYTLQLEACTEAGCTLSDQSHNLQTPPAPPEGVAAPLLFSDTPTSVLLTWEAPARANGRLDTYRLERRVTGTQQVSTVATLSADRPRTYLDTSASLSPWTSYEYRLVATTLNGGSNSSKWARVTTKPSRPAGLLPPQAQVLGPDTVQVTWTPPLIANGEIEHYEIRMPDPVISLTNASVLNYTVTRLMPYTNYSITVLACTAGGGHAGGCTESLPTYVTTLPTIPQGLTPLSVVAVSESFLAVSWQPPTRPNGPHIRYELLRQKTRQPLASSPPEDLNRWRTVYAGTKLFHEDKGLSRFTWYQYKLLVYNDVGYVSGEIFSGVTLAGRPLASSSISALALNHTAIHVNWSTPSLQDLQGEVELYTLWFNSTQQNRSLTFPPGVNSAVISDLRPSTEYHISVSVSNGPHSVPSETVSCITADGEPQGVFPPEVVTLNSSAVRVLWAAPLIANGAITLYSVYVDERLYSTASNTTGSLELTGLLPFTVYDIQVEVCTVYSCVRSNSTQVTTVEDTPSDLAPPHIQVLNSRSVRLDWASPALPNGILLGYDVRRRTLTACAEVQAAQAAHTSRRCVYLECPTEQDICGNSCYQPEHQVCCNGAVHSWRESHQCCGEQYVASGNLSLSVCCGGSFVLPLPHHQCCGGYYVHVPAGEVCCPDPLQHRVSVGLGDRCCGGAPFSSSGGQLCCGGVLHDGYGSQCCGGRLIDSDLVCCRGEDSGTGYTHTPGMACCGDDYANSSTTLCCSAPGLKPKVHPVENVGVGLKCCGVELISQEKECCNGVGYNPVGSVCADRASPGVLIQEHCRPSTVCPVSAVSRAFCGTCDFNPAESICTWVPGESTPTSPPSTQTPTSTPPITTPGAAGPHLCPSYEELVYSGAANRYSFTDTALEPFTSYEYQVGVWNSFGRTFSPPVRVTTREDVPGGVTAPQWSRVGHRDDIIHLEWHPPLKPNGVISQYVVLRDGQERYRGEETSFTDAGGIQPFQEYVYRLRVCNAAGCADGPNVVAVTVQGVPENVPAPEVSALGPRALRLRWTAPGKPNGIVREYRINQSQVGLIHTERSGAMQHTVTGLQPHTSYSFQLSACTAAGCGASQTSTGQTLQDAPTGVWATPRHVLVNCSAVEIHWSEPLHPNGLLSQYRLLRDGTPVFTGDWRNTSYTDTGLQANSRYVYELEASTVGGVGRSGRYVVQTPVSSPGWIPPPQNVSVTGPQSAFVSWSAPGLFDSALPLEYNVLLNAGSEEPSVYPAGGNQSLHLDSLSPFTVYHVRIQACQPDGCGVGPGVFIQTLEAPPKDIDPPTLTAAGATVIEVHWTPPHKSNGLIKTYFIHRRPMGTLEELLVFLWSHGPLEFIDASDSLRPFTKYEYRVTALNSQGSTSSSWANTLTEEAEPQGMDAPMVQATSAYSVLLNWGQPSLPNGVISQYRVVYQKLSSDPTVNSTTVSALTVPGTTLRAHVFGLEPYTGYHVQVEAVNSAGRVSSPWSTVQTLQASPSGLANFSVEKREQGRALLLHWSEPASPNGIIKVYNIYSEDNLEFSGLSRQFLFRRLEPYTVYNLVLEACTYAGCTRTSPQPVTTDEAPPASLPAPFALQVTAHSVELAWVPPAQPNGRLLQYQVMGVGLEEGRARSDEDQSVRAKLLFTQNDTHTSSFSHNISGLQPWSTYRFRVRALNSAGHADSPWLTVHTKQASPKGLAAPAVTHIEGRPYELFISWTPPLETNGVLLTYRIQRDNVGFHFSFDPTVLNYTDRDLAAYTYYSYAVIACTAAGCVTSLPTQIRTLEAPPAKVELPSVMNITSQSFSVSWAIPPIQNGEITRYVLQVNSEEVYRGKRLRAEVTGLQPHTHYHLLLTACTNGGCTASPATNVQTSEAPPIGMSAPVLKVTGSESVEVTWKEPEQANGVITSYELRRDGLLVYVGMDTRYQDFTLLPSVEYSYTVTANNSRGSATSPPAVARTHPSAPSGVAPPRLQPLGPASLMVQWDPPARANGVIISYSLYQRDPAEPNLRRLVFSPQHSAFQSRNHSLTGLKPHHRYELRVEACTLLGCAASDWASVQTLEAPPVGQSATLLELQTDARGLQTVFLLSWSPPSQPNGKLLHYEVYRRQAQSAEGVSAVTLLYRNTSTTHRDTDLLPYTLYEYQVWAVNSAGRTGSPWAQGRTGPAPPEGVGPPKFLRVQATSAVVDISAPAKPNGIISLYRVFAETKDTHLLLSEGTSRQQTLHGLRPFTLYSVGVEACTCLMCCSRGPLSELHTQASSPTQQPPPRPVSITSRSALLEWDQPLYPNGIIESCELQVRGSCPRPWQPVPKACGPGSVETRFMGQARSFNLTGLLPYSSYDLRVLSYNNMGSTGSDWITITTLKEPPQYVKPFVVQSNLTTVFLDWTVSFALNGPLREFVLTESGLRLYSGFHSFIYIPRTSDKTFAFQVTCTTTSGSASSPIIRYNTATGVGPVEPSSGGKTGLYGSGHKFYTELWFILLMAFLGLLLLALLLGLILRRALNKPPFVRERPPLVPLQKRSSLYPPTDSYLRPCSELCSNQNSTALLPSEGGTGFTDTKIGGCTSCVSNHSYQATMSVLRIPSQGQLSHTYSQNSLHRSISQLIDTHDKKSLMDGVWDHEIQGTDSGMFVGDEDFVDTIKTFSSAKKEHTTFTDTHL
ncbi:LOW QUALITY PROTEIN: usherin [Chanos chanos]|uniref:Usherin n=1 Tax=Chanos chanos TaxID=29144 RepID=A0A6J2VG18_CHACN|nr:LOW QUALITY PROTEIN: usherin [Chanos chanos]